MIRRLPISTLFPYTTLFRSNDRRTIELMNSLLFSLPGTPVLYYGDEIGMGDNFYLGDRNGVRTPMQWSADRNAGFSRADRKSTRLNSSHANISYAVFCLKKK